MWLLCLLLAPLLVLAKSSSISADNSYWYDWGVYGAFPQQTYKSFGSSSPWTNVLQSDPRCDNGYLFIEPRGLSVPTPGPIVLDNKGHLVWMETKFGQAMDVKVQKYQGQDYITFWTGSDSGTFGTGRYLMLDTSYEIFKTIEPAGNLTGDLHEFRITDQGTALMTIYERKSVDLSAFKGFSTGFIYDSLFQEVDIATGEMLFEWRASDHYAISETKAPIRSYGLGRKSAFDFFHINSIDKDGDGNYLISSRYMCAVTCISPAGELLWQLGGERNNFTDLSQGAATNFTWQHHASWHQNNTITIFDNGAYDKLRTAKYSRGLLVRLDFEKMTATLIQDYVAPQHLLVPSQGSMQMLPDSDTVLVGWGHTPAYTEFAPNGDVLCDVHIGAVAISFLGWCKNYRTFKSPWIGHPKTAPDVAMRPGEDALYVSWNGATEVENWVLQTSTTSETEDFIDVGKVKKESFETRIALPKEAKEFVRVAAVDKDGNILAYSKAGSKKIKTSPAKIVAPFFPLLSYLVILASIGFMACVVVICLFKSQIRRALNRVFRGAMSYSYQALPTVADDDVELTPTNGSPKH